ncbi:MAG: GNAT family N-acetyltransferase [Muribaculaceae bacterium]|nr:GNAT family N-acetyltransferase [Muribaculaceae bacterium]MBQ7205642.1 GNAT family N-acetyltransferase [Muribaculaceae bacterium]
MLRTVEINSRNANDVELRRLYETAFPEQEQIPYDDLIYLLDAMDIDYTAYYEEDMLVGLTMVLRLPKYNWGWYFAVRDELRGKGIGQGILTTVLNKYSEGNPFVIDIESPLQADAPNPEQRKRRHAFYLRNGMRDTGTSRSWDGLTFTILTNSDEPFTQQDYDDIVAELRAVWENMPGEKD